MINSDPVEIIKLRDWNRAYRTGKPFVSDETYDALLNAAKEKYPTHPFFTQVGYLSSDFGKEVPLEYIMGSLRNYHYYPDKTNSKYKKDDDTDTFLAKYNNGSGWFITDKIDGLSVMVTWLDGKISHAELRGDHLTGTDCTDKVKMILQNKEFPGWIKVVLRGEIVLTGDPADLGLKNRRNGAVGIMKRETLENVDRLKIYFYEMVDRIGTVDSFAVQCLPTKETERLIEIEHNGLDVVSHYYMCRDTPLSTIAQYLEKSAQDFVADKYDSDGKVICPNLYVRENSELPDGKIAFKKQSQVYLTEITDITSQVSRMGKLIPVVHYNPIDIGGVTCCNATGFNYQFIAKNNIGIGSKILICRSQEVIPYITSVVEAKNCSLPSICPDCGHSVRWDENEVHLMCRNLNCPSQALKNITHYFISLGLEEFSEASFEKLGVKSIFDVYELTADKIKAIEGFGDKSAQDLVRRIQDTKRTKPELLIEALGIEFVGKTVSKILVKNFSWEDIKNVKITTESLTKLPGIAEKKAKYIIEGLKEMSHVITQLEDIGVAAASSGGRLEEKTFCVTGSLKSMTRSQVEKWIIDNGGSVSGIKKMTGMYLVCNESSSSAKYKKAQEYGIPIITEEELFAMVK